MTSYFTLCPYCGTDLKAKQFGLIGPLTCQCGWVDPSSEKVKRAAAERQTVIKIVVVGIALLFGFFHMMSWGNYAFKIPFVRAQQAVGLLSADGYWELAQVCVNLNKWSCAENAHERAFTKSNNPAYLEKLAKLQTKLEKPSDAVATYYRYFEAGGKDGEAMLSYAKLLESQSRTKEAIKYYELSIKARPDRLPVRATAAIVKILIKQNQLREARARLVAFHRSAGNSESYLQDELAQVDKLIRQKSRAVASAK